MSHSPNDHILELRTSAESPLAVFPCSKCLQSPGILLARPQTIPQLER